MSAPAQERCPMGGLHNPRRFGDKGELGGLSCRKCHKTWSFVAISPAHVRLEATWPDHIARMT